MSCWPTWYHVFTTLSLTPTVIFYKWWPVLPVQHSQISYINTKLIFTSVCPLLPVHELDFLNCSNPSQGDGKTVTKTFSLQSSRHFQWTLHQWPDVDLNIVLYLCVWQRVVFLHQIGSSRVFVSDWYSPPTGLSANSENQQIEILFCLILSQRIKP